MGTAIRDFNEKMIGYLKTFTDGLDKSLFVEKRSFQLTFCKNGKTYEVKEVIPKYMDAPSDFIAYYWIEFKYSVDNRKYRFTMFLKDFDHNTGNIHVIPGMFQFWKKTEDDESGFSISKDKTSPIEVKRGNVFEKPYCGHGGGRTYIEEGWEPCVVNEHGNKFYNIISSDDCVICMTQKINKNFLQSVSIPEGFKQECKRATESKMIYDEIIINEIYGDYKGNGGGVFTYSMLRWVNCDENGEPKTKKEKDSWKKMKPLFSVIYIDDLGFFYVLGQHQKLKVYDLNVGKTGINTVNGYENETDELPNPYYWEINY